jgi:hypothetical protein
MGKTQKNQFDISGRVLFVGEPVWYSDKMSKKILVLEVWVESKYKKEVPFEFINNNMDCLANIRKDDWVSVEFHLSGRKHIQGDGKNRWYSNNEGVNVIIDE